MKINSLLLANRKWHRIWRGYAHTQHMNMLSQVYYKVSPIPGSKKLLVYTQSGRLYIKIKDLKL